MTGAEGNEWRSSDGLQCNGTEEILKRREK
jgi:hypothetical protein